MVPKDDTSPPIGKRHERSISIQQAQDVSLMAGKRHEQPISIQRVQDVSLIGSVQRLLARSGGLVRATVAGVVARLRWGRPPYERAPITAVVEEAFAGGVDRTLDHLVGRVRSLLELRGIPAPGDTVLTGICKPIYMHAQGAKK